MRPSVSMTLSRADVGIPAGKAGSRRTRPYSGFQPVEGRTQVGEDDLGAFDTRASRTSLDDSSQLRVPSFLRRAKVPLGYYAQAAASFGLGDVYRLGEESTATEGMP